MENFCEYYSFSIIVSINSFSALNITVNTALKDYHKQALKKKKIDGSGQDFFSEKINRP